MKNLLYLFVYFLIFPLYAQQNYQPVLELLFQNKRTEARQLFDKNFSKTKNNNLELLLIDVLIDQENGKVLFDDSFLKQIEKFPEAKYYVAALIKENFIYGDVNEDDYNDLTFLKGDFLINSPSFNQLPIVVYRTAVAEQKKRNFDKSNQLFNQLNTIVKWQRCGVFENLNGSGIHTEYEPESYAKNDKFFNTNSNGMVGWYNPVNHKDEGYIIYYNEKEYGSGIMYAQTFIDAPETKKYLLRFGASAAIKFFLNDEEIILKEDISSNNLDAFLYEIELAKGTNRLLVKLDASKSLNYFSASILQSNGQVDNDLVFNDSYKPYQRLNNQIIIQKDLDYELYFKNLLAKDPSNLLNRYLLFNAYAENSKKELAHEVIEPLEEKYQKSSFFQGLLMRYYSMEEDDNKVIEISKNIEQNDPAYFLNTFVKILDQDWMSNANQTEFDKYYDYSKTFISPGAKYLLEFMNAAKESNIELMFEKYDLVKMAYSNSSQMAIAEANMYKQLKNDKDKYLELLLAFDNQYYDYEVDNSIISSYRELNKKDKIKERLESNILNNPNINYLRTDLANEYAKASEYDKAIKLIDENIAYFPFSFSNFQRKAEVLNLMKDKVGAEKYYKKVLTHNSSDTKVRKELYEILKIKDEIDEVETKNFYDLIKKRRNTSLKSDAGVTILHDEQIINIYPEGGRKIKVNYVYEVTSESGIENLKEYALDTSSINLTKSEIVKQNGALMPAEDNGNMLVFTNLAVGDVIYIAYDYSENSYGRFYKDFNLSHQFNGNYATIESVLKIIYPNDVKFQTAFINEQLPTIEKNLGSKIVKEWRKENAQNLPIYESYAPAYADLVTTAQISTITNWNEIANWYADLVKKSMKYDKVTEKAFQQIFPNGFNDKTDYQKAYEIYKYIGQNITYSFLDFRQSGYVPQKPSKTITTKLGDCKDLSTLFVILAEKAGIKANLVLVLTNDNGFKQLPLPSKQFNHCIVSVQIEGQQYFLEMTDGYLPFLALPTSLYQASALQVYFDKNLNEKANLIAIPYSNNLQNQFKSLSTVQINDQEKIFTTQFTFKGNSKTYFNEIFSEKTSEDVRKKDLENYLNGAIANTTILMDYKLVKNDRFDEDMIFEIKFKIKEKTQKLGSLQILNLNFVGQPYNNEIISLENRSFDIKYVYYEGVNLYETEVIYQLAEGQNFIEIPESKQFNFKELSYELKFDLISPNQLKVNRIANIKWDDIASKDYSTYKKYVEGILESEKQIVGFK